MGPKKTAILMMCLLFTMVSCNDQPEELVAVPTATPTAENTKTPKPAEIVTTIPTESFYDRFNIYPDMRETVENFPNVASSTSTLPLWDKIFCSLFQIYCTWLLDRIGPELSDDQRQEFLEFKSAHIVDTGTHDAYVSLVNGNSDIILVARQPSEDEINLAQEQGVSFDIRPVALDAFVFIVNVHNPVDNLSLEQIRAIYSGEITNWSEVGGQNLEIHAYQRDENSGSQELMNSLVMQNTPMIDAPDMIRSSMIGPFTAIGSTTGEDGDLGGIGFSVYFFANNMISDDEIEFIGINGVEPTYASIASGDYLLATEVYVVTREDEPMNSPSSQLREWIFSPSGQNGAVAGSGYIPIPQE